MANTTTLEHYKVVPQILPQGTKFTNSLMLKFGDNVTLKIAGNEIDRQMVQVEPDVYSDADTESTFTLIMTDPDLMGENDQFNKQVRHWVQPGLKFSGLDQPAQKTKLAVSNYVGPAPAPGTGGHRYVFILCREKGTSVPLNEDFGNKNAPAEDLKDRMGFDAYQYIENKGLEVVAATFMVVDANLQSTVDNVKLMTEAAVHKLQGK